MSDRWKAFWLGSFIVVATGLAAWLILFIKPSVGDGKVELRVRFSNIDKVSQGTLVTFAGRQVGFVHEIKEIADPRLAPADAYGNLYIYELVLKVDSSVKVYLYDEIIYATAGLLGEKSIAIIPKAPPPGAPQTYDVTYEVLYARSTDRFEQAMNDLVGVAGTFQDTLEEITTFIETNNQDFNHTLKSLASAAHEIHTFMGHANENELVKTAARTLSRADEFFTSAVETHVVERLGESFDSLYEAASLFTQGEGTVARLANSDCLYVQLTTVMCQLQTVLHDIKNYGLLFQFDRKWQRQNNLRRNCTEMPAGSYPGS